MLHIPNLVASEVYGNKIHIWLENFNQVVNLLSPISIAAECTALIEDIQNMLGTFQFYNNLVLDKQCGKELGLLSCSIPRLPLSGCYNYPLKPCFS